MKIRLAAQMQALALAIANANPHTFQTSATLVAHPEAKKLGAQDHHAISALTVLHKIGKLTRFRTASGKTRYGYELPPEEKAAAILRRRDKEAAPAPTPALLPADIKITAVGDRLRIQFKGLVLDIGVE